MHASVETTQTHQGRQRQSNQQQVIQAILTEAVRLKDVNKALKVLDAAGENVSTNLSMEQMIGLFNLTMKKMNRSYVQNQNVFNVIGARPGAEPDVNCPVVSGLDRRQQESDPSGV